MMCYTRKYKLYLKQCKVVPADDVIQLGEEDNQERPTEEGQDAPNNLDPCLQAERAAAVPRVKATVAKLDELRSEKIYTFYVDIYLCLFYLTIIQQYRRKTAKMAGTSPNNLENKQ